MRRLLIAISLLSVTASAEPIIKLPAAILINGLASETSVIVVSDRRDTETTTDYRATATFRSDANGVVDLGRDPALEGDYRGIDPIGIFWTARRHWALIRSSFCSGARKAERSPHAPTHRCLRHEDMPCLGFPIIRRRSTRTSCRVCRRASPIFRSIAWPQCMLGFANKGAST